MTRLSANFCAARVREQAGEHGDAGPVFPAHGEDGGGLDHDLEYLDLLAGEFEQAAGHDQVAGGRNRQEFRQAFDDAHDQRFEGKNGVHVCGSRMVKVSKPASTT